MNVELQNGSVGQYPTTLFMLLDKFFRTQYPQKLTTALEADFHQKLLMKFTLKDKSSGETFTAHQTFVKLTNTDTKQEIIFVAEADSTNNYKFDLVCRV